MSDWHDLLGNGPRPVDRERTLRLMLAVLNGNDSAYFDTLGDILADEDDRPALAATLNVLFVAVNNVATLASERLGVDTARQVMLEELKDSLRGDE